MKKLATFALVVAVALLLGATRAAANAAFDDPAADQVNTVDLVAPDITSVQVTNTRTGLITFRVTIGNYQSLPAHSTIVLLFDLDRNIATGDQGFEYAVSHVVDPSGQIRLRFERWDEGDFRLFEIPATRLTSSFAAGVYTLTIPRSELGNTIRFSFGMYAASFDPQERDPAVDSAPNTELWNYDLVGLPALRLTTRGLAVNPGRPVAGRSFVVHAEVRRSDDGSRVTTGRAQCSARVGQTKVRTAPGFANGRWRCVVLVPANAKGKTLRVTLTVRSAGAVLTRTFGARVG